MATEGTIRNIVRTLDRFDAHLDAMKEDDAKSLLGKLKKLVKTFDIPASKVSEGTRKSAPPPTKEVNTKTSTSNRKSNTDKEKSAMATASTTDVMPKSERAAYAEAHGLKLKGSPEVQTAQVHAHQKHFAALIKKGAERLMALGSKNVEGFKVDGRIKSDDKRAAAAADLILAAGYIPAGKGIAKPDEDETPVKKTTTKKASAPEEKKTSKKAEAKASSKKTSSKRTRDEDEDDEDDEDTTPVKKTKKVKKVVEEAPKKKKAKKAKVEEAPVKKTKKSKEEKVSSKKKVKRSRD